MEIDEEAAKRASANLFEAYFKTLCFSVITDRLVEKGLITKEEEKKIRKKIEKMREEALMPKPEKISEHNRKIFCTEALPDDVVRETQRREYLEKQKKKQKSKN